MLSNVQGDHSLGRNIGSRKLDRRLNGYQCHFASNSKICLVFFSKHKICYTQLNRFWGRFKISELAQNKTDFVVRDIAKTRATKHVYNYLKAHVIPQATISALSETHFRYCLIRFAFQIPKVYFYFLIFNHLKEKKSRSITTQLTNAQTRQLQ